MRELALASEQQRQEGDSRIVKALERAKKQLETKLKELAAKEKKDDGLTFEELGVDTILGDEAHCWKNLFYVSKMTRIAGLPQTASQRAFDMFLKVQHVQRVNGGGGVVFSTGTPIANSVAEMFTMQRFLQMATLKAQNIAHFDAWTATFGEPVTAMELAPDGSGYRVNTRFARFINVPELMQMFRQVADIQTQAMLKLPVPDLHGGKPTVISAPCWPELKQIVASLVDRAEALRTGRVDPREDNMLLVTTDGRKAALDLRLHDPRLPDHPDSKVNQAVATIEPLIALHHLDAPWRPADVEHRESRILRQGNRNAEVQIYRYVTEESFDAYSWQTLETKARFIARVMNGETDLRRIEDLDGAALN